MLEAFILGIVEGLTEFLPISSTGHLIVVSEWLGIEHTDSHKAFEVIIQLAAILAVIANYFDKFTPKHLPLWINIGISIIPISIIGFLFHDVIKDLFNISVVAWMFIIGGFVFIIVEKLWNGDSYRITSMEKVDPIRAWHIGLFQTFALIPGTSRAGASIIGGVIMGLDRKTATEWSFLMALPVLTLAAGFDLVNNYQMFIGADFVNIGIGFFTAFVVAYFSMRLFLSFLERFTLIAFGYYRILFGIILLTFFV